jgi:protein gp37
MAESSTIEWTDATWTPIRARYFPHEGEKGYPERIGWHCEHISPGCKHCYAESINLRLGTGFAFKPAHLKHKMPGDQAARGDVDVFLDEGMLVRPLRWRKPREIFVCSMTDLFADFVRPQWIDKVFAVAALTPWHTYQVLTKRASRMHRYLSAATARDVIVGTAWEMLGRLPKFKHDVLRTSWPLPNVHVGVSIEDQRRNDERLHLLKATPAASRFVSFEPLLEQVTADLGGIDLAIIGGESGRGARDCATAWIASLIDQARRAGCAAFVKQLGARARVGEPGAITAYLKLKDAKGGDIGEWPTFLQVREPMRTGA